MGRNKALLSFRGGALVVHVASAVEAAAGSVTLIGDPGQYAGLGYPVIPDRSPGNGPAGGIETALRHTAAEWNLVVACDMPALTADFLRELLDAAESSKADAVLSAGPTGRLEPLCAAYHRRCAPAIGRAVESGVRKVTDALAGLHVVTWKVEDSGCLENLNTPEEWARYDAH
jgi:molybdopterin-guanine dinucleotide biosynthesis protein A